MVTNRAVIKFRPKRSMFNVREHPKPIGQYRADHI
jgi:hypothetical protein